MECLSSRREPEAPGGGRAKIENSSRRHLRKSGQKRFLAVRRSWRGNGVACFWATSLQEIIGGVIDLVPLRRMDAAVCHAEVCYPFCREAREASGGETPRVHNVARWCGRVADRGACATAGETTNCRVLGRQ